MADGAPHDVPPPDPRRARRGPPWLLGDAAGAARAGRGALRGAPGDPEAALPWRAPGAAPAAAPQEALRRASSRSSRGAARAAPPRAPGGPLAPVGARRRGSGRSARARAAGQPRALAALRLALVLPAGAEPDPLLAPALPAWPAPRVVVTEEARAEAAALVSASHAFPREREPEALALLERAVALDPETRAVRWEYATSFSRTQEHGPEGLVEWGRYLRADPPHVFALLMRWRHDLLESYTYRPLDPLAVADDALRPGGDEGARHVPWLVMHQLGLLYPADAPPRWPRATSEEVRARLDRVLLADPGLVGLLYLRAQLMALDGRQAAARRDLALVSDLVRALPDRAGFQAVYDDLSRLWVLATNGDHEAALRVVEGLERAPVLGKKPATRVVRWLTEDPHLAPVRGAPLYKRLLAEFSPR
ncbi:MAG: hypothetical protein KF878_24205 [Planctomycetes bacterium]|nr:hypothetical protein [Planctomycetota bacterium]